MASELLWGVWVRGAAQMDVLGTALPALFCISELPWTQSLTRFSTVELSPVPVWNILPLPSRRRPNGFREHQNPGWCGRCEQGVLVAG